MTHLPAPYEPTPEIQPIPPMASGSGTHTSLPGDIYTEEASLYELLDRSEGIRNEADGLFGPIGVDGLTGLIPGVGALYTAYAMLRLQGCASAARCGMGIRFTGILLGIADIVIGIFVGVGDVVDFFFRSSAMFASIIQRDIRRKLLLIETARLQLSEVGHLTDADVARLRDHLLRGGKSEQQSTVQMWVGIGLLLALLYSCAG